MPDSSFYVTTPIYYVNDKPHIGHAYTTILADVLVRYARLFGRQTYFLTGTDEHGQKVQRAAEARHTTPQAHADETVVRFQELWKTLEITNDDFIRTTDERHKVIVQEILQDLYDRGEIYRDEYDGWYCVTCERFYTEKDLVDGKCPEPGCGRAVERIAEANYFFRMSNYQQWLIDYIDQNPTFIQPDFRRNETLGFLRQELTDLCISRPKSRLSWGIELPFDADFVTYVWFDALVNYISAIGYRRDDEQFAALWPAAYHLIGKDILTTHTVYWPTMLKAMGLPLPRTVLAHGWWLSGDSRMSKTTGNVVDPMEYIDRHGVDAFRYFLIAEMVVGQEANFTPEAFARRYNADLANDLGNILSRVTTLIVKHCDGRIPEVSELTDDDRALQDLATATAGRVHEAVERVRLDAAVGAVADLIRETNRYLERRQPWNLARDGDKASLGTVLYHAADVLRIASGLLHPIMPDRMTACRSALGLTADEPDFENLGRWAVLPVGSRVEKGPALFPRIEAPKKKELKKKEDSPMTDDNLIDITEFQNLELKTAKIIGADRVEGADRLLKLQVEVAGEERQVVAGIAQHYTPEDLVGKTVVVVANLKPAKIRGEVSNGMLLAASDGDVLRLLTPDGDIPSGAEVR